MTLSKKHYFIVLFSCLLVCGALLYYFFFSSKRDETPPVKLVEVVHAHPGKIEETVSLLGTINSKHAAILYAKANGRLVIVIPPGQEVQKNTLLAHIDNPDYEKAVKLSEAAEQIAKIQYERLIVLQKKGFVSSKEVDEKKQAWIEAQKALSKAKIDLDLLRFYAPFDGIVGAYKKKDGMQVSPGDSILSIYNPVTLVVDFDIPCTTIKGIKNGQKVSIFNKSYPLSHYQKMIDEESHMCPADVDIACKDCLIGSTVAIDLVVQEKMDTIIIPVSAVFFRNGQAFTYVVIENKIQLVPIRTGIKNNASIEVTQGLQKNVQVVIKGQDRLYPNMPVEIYQPAKTS